MLKALLPAILCPVLALQAQPADTLAGSSLRDDDVVITATRTERKLSNVAVPALLIGKAQLQAVQLRRLNELLQEQTGIFVTSGSGSGSFGGGIFGNGAQLQGMSPDYTLILINGEPIVGRQGGTLNLSRISLSNIKKIEIIKGPASSLYGSEAMGGVINIITELPAANTLQAQAKAGGYGMVDGTVAGTVVNGNTRAHLSYNYHRMGAIDHQPELFGNQQDPFFSHTGQAQVSHLFSNKTRLLLYARFYQERSDNVYEVADENLNPVRISGNTRLHDANLNASLVHQFSQKLTTTLRLYGTAYRSRQQLFQQKDGQPYYSDDFRQQFYRLENQTDWKLSDAHQLTLGAGAVYEQLNTTRYTGVRTNTIAYAFAQHEWRPASRVSVISGLRYDNNQVYASRLSPKLALRYAPTQRLKLTASYGAGFKAPDFRQLYLSFINNASGGYTLFGANEISMQRLTDLQQQGFVAQILPRASDLAELKPEISHGFNAGASYQFSQRFSADVNLFYNDISNQIMFDVVALRPTGSQVFSYFNVARSFTTGAEWNLRYQLNERWQLTGGYQWLFAADKDVYRRVRKGEVFGRRESDGAVYQLRLSDYAGLPGRSRHMANAKLQYQARADKWQASVRAVYRSSWGTFDRDGNAIINRADEMARGFVMLNCTVGVKLGARWRAMAGAENLLNHRDPNNLANLPGITGFVGLSYEWKKQ
ncbi:MAG: TonB-dependent receptor [Chitinophagaceae bacterium]|jgi:outer membrane receptor for ferrienterochelin and colicins|nr:TonB-dependent receptor [Chitinophagaceae bacterium]